MASCSIVLLRQDTNVNQENPEPSFLFRCNVFLQPRDSLEVDADRPLHDAGGHAATADGIYDVSQLTERGTQQTGVSSRGGLEARVVKRIERLQTNLEIEVLAKSGDIRAFDDA